jgi:hypothetical protein
MKYKKIYNVKKIHYDKYIKYKSKYDKLINNNNYNFFFDFDLTLVSEHSSGDALNTNFIMKMKLKSDELNNLKDFLMNLLDNNHNIFIITRGMSYNVAKFLLKYVFDCENNIIQYFNNYCHVININNKFIYIFGSSVLEDINFIDNNKLVNILKIKVNNELKEHMLKNNTNYTEKWGITKVIFILFIINKILHNKSSNNYFFDDTKENIDLVEKYIGINNNIICYGFDNCDLKSKFIDIIKNIINNIIFYNSSI